jgi:anti-anti-sigma factor
MEITTQQIGDGLEVKVNGRLDNYWGEYLQRKLEELIREGAHQLLLNCSDVSYLSSAGVGVLMRFYRQLKAMGGSFGIVAPSEHVKLVIELCHLSPLLFSQQSATPAQEKQVLSRRFATPAANFELVELAVTNPLTFEAIGDPSLLKGCRFREQDCRKIRFPAPSFGLGLGALGHGFEEARTRFGEFLAVAGSAAYLPTDGTNLPDFIVSNGDLVPELHTLYGFRCNGDFSLMLRFEACGPGNAVSLSNLAHTALEVSNSPAVGLVMIAESAGLVGASLRRSPADAGKEGSLFEYPEVRSWLSFSTERFYSRSLTLAVGVASSACSLPLDSLLRPLAERGGPSGHFHAAAFSYRPIQKGKIELKSTITALFETEKLLGVLHLLTDDRQIAGAQQSEFVRGACWMGALSEVQ